MTIDKLSRIGKNCIDCSTILTEDNIVKGSGILRCKPCFNAKQREWRARTPELTKARKARNYEKQRDEYIKRATKWAKQNKEKRQKSNKNWRWKIRLQMIDAYGGKCVCCGEENKEFLTIDHIKNDGYKKRQEGEQSGAALYKKLRDQNWPKEEYQLLCMNCNFAKGHWGICPHQTQKNKIESTGNELG
jgi:hypothetical protein